jgi:hypothetical protein
VGGTLLLAVDSAQVATFYEALVELGFQVVKER